MGISTNAILFYGYCWDDEDVHNLWETADSEEALENGDEDWETRYARAKGCLQPREPYPERTVTPTRENNYDSTPKDYSAAEQVIIDQHRAYWRDKGRITEAAPCLVATHCSTSCPMAYVAVSASRTISPRGSPCEITSLAVDPAWDGLLAEFCKTLGIPTEGLRAAWWLVSDWS